METPAFVEQLNALLDKLGVAKCATLMCESIACRLGTPTSVEQLYALMDELGIDRFVRLLSQQGIVVRLHLLDGFLLFYADAPTWTQKMTHDFCRKVPWSQVTQVEETVWMELHDNASSRKRKSIEN